VRAGLAQRARVVLLVAQGASNTAIAEQVGVSRPTVIGAGSLRDQGGWTGWTTNRARVVPGRSITQRYHRHLEAAPPKKLGVTHWSTRLLARQLGIGVATVAKAWRDYRVQPWRSQTFKFSTDPELVAAAMAAVSAD